MIGIKINGQPFQFPVDVTELTNKQFFGLIGANDILDELSAITGFDRTKIENFKDLKTIEAAQSLTKVLAESIAKGFDGVNRPEVFTIGKKQIKVPNELRLQPIGAFMSVHDILANHVNEQTAAGVEPDNINYTSLIPKVLAHYFFLPYYGDGVLYSEEKAESVEFMELIMNCNFVQSTQIGNFFFRNIGRLT